MTRLKIAAVGGLLLGAALLTALVAIQGVDDILTLMSAAGYGLPALSAFHLLPVLSNALAWRALLDQPPAIPVLFRQRWLADSINALLPVAQVGGELARGRLLMRATGLSGAQAAAGVIADLTMGLATLVVFIVGGLILLAERNASVSGLAAPLGGTAACAAMLYGFYRLQRSKLLTALAHRIGHQAGAEALTESNGGTASTAHALDAALDAVYGQRGALLRCALWRFGGWFGGAAELWLTLTILGHPVSMVEAVILESLGQAVRNVGFAIPGALGVQEGGLMMAGAAIGLPADVALTLGLVKRVRDLILGVPCLLIWQFNESRRTLRSGT